MNVRVLAAVALLVAGLAGEDLDALARDTGRTLAAAQAAFARAEAADAVDDEPAASAALRAARRDLDAAIAGCRRLIAARPADAAAHEWLAAAAAVGRTCCGRQSLWERYEVGTGR